MHESLSITLSDRQQALLGGTIPDALDLAATTWGDQPALVAIEGDLADLTWSELRDQVARLRSGMERLGLRPGDKVAILLGNGVTFPLVWLAIIEAGAVAVPMNPRYTRKEVDFVLSDSEARWCVTTEDIAGRLGLGEGIATIPARQLLFTTSSSSPDVPSIADLLRSEIAPRTYSASPSDVVNIQFTSGTTGLPKGCLLTHEYWIEFGAYASALFDEPQRLLADHPFFYMQNQAYFWIALAGGGALYITAGLSRRKFMGWLLEHRIDFAWIDEGLLDEPARDTDRDLAIRKAPISDVPGPLHRELEQRFGLQARDWYASTEAGNGTFVPWDRDDLVGRSTIGLAWPTRETKIVDPDGVEVADGVAGELVLRGSGMMIGYHNRPEANAELFLPGGWYRTGDVVIKDEAGLHYFQGRIKDMIKRSGENISCAEVELHIMELPQVEEVGVVPVPDAARGEEVKAVVVLKPGATLTPVEIESWCRDGLASFKIPRYVEFRPDLPHTSSGKVAKSVLRGESEPLHAGVVDLRAVLA